MKILRLISMLENYSRQLEESGFDSKGGKYNLSAPAELRRIIANSGLQYNFLFNPKKIKLSDYINFRDALLGFQNEYGLNVQEQIDELGEYIDNNTAITQLPNNTASLPDVRKAYIGKVLDIGKLQNCENKRFNEGVLSFHFYLEDEFEEYMYNVRIHLDGMRIVLIEPMRGQKLKTETERRVDYVPCRTKAEHYAELGEILAKATD